jgi:hypothetical protein
MKKHYETHVEDTDKLISVAGPVLDYKSWYEQYRKLMEEQAQRKYGLYTPTSEGDEDDFPSIPGMIARYSALGLTNEQMKENPVWVDKTGNGHGLQMKNLAWGGMSGVGGYEMNFNSWTNNVPSISDISMSKTTSSVSVSVGNSAYNNNLIYIHKNNWDVNKNHWLKVASTYEDGDLAFVFYNDKNTKKIELPANGYVNIPAYPEFKGNYMYISTTSNKQGSFTIEQLPLYPGALVFDGVDDWAGCDNLPLLPKEKGYSIIALRNWITRYDATKYKRPLISNLDTNDEGAFLIEYRKDENVNDVTRSYNSFTDVYIDDNNPITWQTSSSYNGQIIKKGTSKSTNKLCICKTYFGQLSNYANAAIWEIVILDHDATEEELTKIKDYFVKTYPWLFPDQAWTVVGKTNEDEDRATIANITGNGNDLVLSNFGFAEGSGYNEEGEYAGYLVTDGVDDKIISSIFKMGNDWTVIGDWELINTGKNDNAGIVKFDSIVIYNYNSMLINIKNGRNILIPDQNTVNAICSDGRIYSKDWKESIYNEETESTSKNFLTIGYSGNAYTKIAFKNLAIYPTVLSREDCIKAYNYLQTLKAK